MICILNEVIYSLYVHLYGSTIHYCIIISRDKFKLCFTSLLKTAVRLVPYIIGKYERVCMWVSCASNDCLLGGFMFFYRFIG